MIYNGKEMPKLGFGLMRLPMLEGGIDIEQTKAMVDMFIENGFTYFDTAYGYIDQKSEGATKIALVDRYPRESFQLATKLPAWSGNETKEEAEQMFFTSLERAGVDYFDFYLLHNLGGIRTASFDKFDIWNFTIKQKELGKIKQLGFSIHDSAEALEDVLCKHHQDVDFVQLQINYADWEDTIVQSRKCYEVAEKYNKPVIVMEPIRGGGLANPPKSVSDVFDAYSKDMSYAQWAVRYAASFDNVLTVLSGMSNIEQMQDNISYMKNFKPLNKEEQKVITKVQEIFSSIESIPCTNCRYCVKDCPQNVAIPEIFFAMNKKLIYEDFAAGKASYNFFTGIKTTESSVAKASACIECGLCESVCPQSIAIVEELKRAVDMFE